MNIRPWVKGGLLSLLIFGMSTPALAAEMASGWEKIIFHLDEKINARWALMLANGYMEDNPKAKIVFVTYGPGIDFLVNDAVDKRGNPYDPRVNALVEKGVEFRVCAGTLSARNIAAEELLDAAKVVPSGVSEIARLQIKEGYAYLKP